MTKTKLFFLLSNDYGELAGAIHFTTGCAFDVVLAAPARLYDANREQQPLRMMRYESVRDILDLVDHEAPDIVLLSSGYLYTINQLLSIEDFAELIRQLQTRECALVTTDPFLGIMGEIDSATFSDHHPLGQAFTEHFTRVFDVLKNLIHLYPVDPRGLVRAPSACAFNPKAILAPAVLAAQNRQVVRDLRLDPEKPRWAFVLSTEDYLGQTSRKGRESFERELRQRLGETSAQGRQAILIAPETCLSSIRQVAETTPDVRLLSFFDYETFRALLLEVEYAFYWNILSNSILNRVINRRPVFFFDRGHLIHAIQPMYEQAHQRYYAGGELPFLPPEAPLENERLGLLAKQQDPLLSTIADRFLQLPTPEEIVAVILRNRPT